MELQAGRQLSSKRHCFRQDAIADAGLQSAAADDVHPASEELLQFQRQCGVVKQASSWIEVDDEIDVATLIVSTASRRVRLIAS